MHCSVYDSKNEKKFISDQDAYDIYHRVFRRTVQVFLTTNITDRANGTRTFCRKTLCRTTLCRKTFCRKTFCRRTISRMDFLSNGHFDKRTLRRKDILPKGQLAENREISGNVMRVCNSQPLYKITIVWSLPVHNGSLTVRNHINY